MREMKKLRSVAIILASQAGYGANMLYTTKVTSLFSAAYLNQSPLFYHRVLSVTTTAKTAKTRFFSFHSDNSDA